MTTRRRWRTTRTQPSTPQTAGCDHTVYVRLIQNDGAAATFQDTIKVDSNIDASRCAANPHMLGLPPSYNQIGLNDAYVNGVGGA